MIKAHFHRQSNGLSGCCIQPTAFVYRSFITPSILIPIIGIIIAIPGGGLVA
ncbi:MAG: hypothetical protein AB1489_31440 [Acidobacteriota bacterium]